MPQVQTGFSTADCDLQRRVSSFLNRFNLGCRRTVQVEAKQGFITLLGTVPSFQHRQLCIEFSKYVDGVTEVNDCLSVSIDPVESNPRETKRLVVDKPHRANCDRQLYSVHWLPIT